MKCSTCGKEGCFEHGGDVKGKKILPKPKFDKEKVREEGMASLKEKGKKHEEGVERMKPFSDAAQNHLKGIKIYEDDDEKFAKGGRVNHERGVNRSTDEKGVSLAGHYTRLDRNSGYDSNEDGHPYKKAVDTHDDVINENRKINPKLKGLAEGGEIEKEHPDDELNHHVAGELMDAIDKKDHKGVLDSIKAIVLNCGGKV